MKPHRLLPAADCPHLTLDARTVPATCRQCGTPWAELTTDTHRTRIAQHAAEQHCDACGANHYPHGDDVMPPRVLSAPNASSTNAAPTAKGIRKRWADTTPTAREEVNPSDQT